MTPAWPALPGVTPDTPHDCLVVVLEEGAVAIVRECYGSQTGRGLHQECVPCARRVKAGWEVPLTLDDDEDEA